MAPTATVSQGKKREAAALLDSDGEEIEVLGSSSKVKKSSSRQDEPKKVHTSSPNPPVSHTNKPIHSFFSKIGSSSSAAAVASERITWHSSIGHEQSCLVGDFRKALQTVAQQSQSSKGSRQKIAAFDLDGNLIETSSGRAAYNFTDENDFRIWGRSPKERSAVKTKLEEEFKSGSLILVITNQLNLDSKPARLKVWKARLGLILRQLDVPVVVFASLRKDAYRKPGAGWVQELRQMWSAVGATKELDIAPGEAVDTWDQSRSFLVGDAAGRTALGGRKADFADTDRKLAHNLGWRFFTPEEHFAGEKSADFEWSGYQPAPHAKAPSAFTSSSSRSRLRDLRSRLLADKQPTLLILVGPQASGKSYFAKRLVEEAKLEWVRVNQDTLKTREKCLQATKEALKEGKSVVVDNTNPTKAVRTQYTSLAKSCGAKRTSCLFFDVTLEEAQHNDAFRSKRWLFPSPATSTSSTSSGDPLPRPMPSIAFHSYFKSLEIPQVGDEDGLQEVIRVGFEFDGDAEDEKAWRLWYS